MIAGYGAKKYQVISSRFAETAVHLKTQLAAGRFCGARSFFNHLSELRCISA
jgi:hypothetical protein